MKRFFAVILLTLLCSNAIAEVKVTVNPTVKKWHISPLLLGMHTIYYVEDDSAYADGRIAKWAKTVPIGTMRFPGGSVVKYWDWENPTGIATGDRYDPKWDREAALAKNWMSLDEYLDFVRQSGITPLLGVNFRSGFVYGRTQDGIDRAVRMIEKVKAAGLGGAYWYIGNEDAFQVGGNTAAAKLFVEYAKAMKAADPKIRIFWNNNKANAKNVKEYLSIAGPWADGVEFHGKWPVGGQRGKNRGCTFKEWQKEVPLLMHETVPQAWRERSFEIRRAAAEAGYPKLLIANNEYGLGKPKLVSTKLGFTRYTVGLLLTEFTMEHIVGNYDMACFWANIRGDYDGLLSRPNNYRLNPVALGWELIGPSLDGEFVEMSSSDRYTHGYASLKAGKLYIYLLNKSDEKQPIEISIQTGRSFALESIDSMQNNSDGWGKIVKSEGQSTVANSFRFLSEPLSFSRITLTTK